MPARFSPQKKATYPIANMSERLKRTINAYRKMEFKYEIENWKDKAELTLDIYKQKYPDLCKRNLITLVRAKIPEGCFELDFEGTIDKEYKVREALVYSTSETVFSPDNPETEGICQASFLYGLYRRPFGVIKRDEFGNVVQKGTYIKGYTNMFWIPFTPENVQKVLDEYSGKYRNTVLAIADKGAVDYYGSNTYQIPSLIEWSREDFDLLLEANQDKGKWLKDEPGGAKLFLKKKLETRQEMEKEIEQFTKSGKTKTGK